MFLSVVKADVQFPDGRTDSTNYIFKTPFCLQSNKHNLIFIANAFVNRHPNFKVQYKTLLISLREYIAYNITENLITLIDTKNNIKYKIISIKNINFETYSIIKNYLSIETFSIERKTEVI